MGIVLFLADRAFWFDVLQNFTTKSLLHTFIQNICNLSTSLMEYFKLQFTKKLHKKHVLVFVALPTFKRQYTTN